MRLSDSLFRTERVAPSDAQLQSHKLLFRAGLVKQISSGIYSLTPLALRVIHNIVNIAREEMSRVGGQEVLLPVAQPASLWEQSGRYQKVDSSLARWKDRNDQEMVLAMTHEEAVTDLVRHFVHSYKQLPIMVYQIQTKFRDEPRPRGGLVRLREFLMKDGYSFHEDTDDLDTFYKQMIIAYEAFYKRCGVNVLQVEADTGMMGGGISHEFMVLSDGGEDTLVTCSNCGYAANREVAISAKPSNQPTINPSWTLYVGLQGEKIAVGAPSGAIISEVKVARVLGIADIREATTGELEQIGLSEPLNAAALASRGISLLIDDSLASSNRFETGSHQVGDIIAVQSGDHCINCGHELETVRGIEVGNIFKLGTRYSVPMGAEFAHRDGTLRPFVMGCYGIGITRMLACIIEDNHDEYGIIFPESVAPYKFHLVSVGTDNDVISAADNVYNLLGIEQVLYDDRDVTAGVKFADSDLLGLPYRLTVSKRSLATESVEVKNRRTGEITLVPIYDIGTVLR
jgi:prolyl-tRNA synthetase